MEGSVSIKDNAATVLAHGVVIHFKWECDSAVLAFNFMTQVSLVAPVNGTERRIGASKSKFVVGGAKRVRRGLDQNGGDGRISCLTTRNLRRHRGCKSADPEPLLPSSMAFNTGSQNPFLAEALFEPSQDVNYIAHGKLRRMLTLADASYFSDGNQEDEELEENYPSSASASTSASQLELTKNPQDIQAQRRKPRWLSKFVNDLERPLPPPVFHSLSKPRFSRSMSDSGARITQQVPPSQKSSSISVSIIAEQRQRFRENAAAIPEDEDYVNDSDKWAEAFADAMRLAATVSDSGAEEVGPTS
eukprot:gene24147-9733_t